MQGLWTGTVCTFYLLRKDSFTLSGIERESNFFYFCHCLMWTLNWILNETIWKRCCFRTNINEPLIRVFVLKFLSQTHGKINNDKIVLFLTLLSLNWMTGLLDRETPCLNICVLFDRFSVEVITCILTKELTQVKELIVNDLQMLPSLIFFPKVTTWLQKFISCISFQK